MENNQKNESSQQSDSRLNQQSSNDGNKEEINSGNTITNRNRQKNLQSGYRLPERSDFRRDRQHQGYSPKMYLNSIVEDTEES